MAFEVESRHLGEVVVLAGKAFQDNRGFFIETYRQDQFEELGLPGIFVQDNHSCSQEGRDPRFAFSVGPADGQIDARDAWSGVFGGGGFAAGSPTLGKWVGVEASAENRKQVWAPASFARGFCALTDDAEVQYKCTGMYNSKAESAIRWDDPEIGIEWPMRDVIISEKDRNAQTLAQWLASENARQFRMPELVSA